MDYELHGQGNCLRAGHGWPAITVTNHFLKRKYMPRDPNGAGYGPSTEMRSMANARKTSGVYKMSTSGLYKRRHTKRKGAAKKGRKSCRRRR